MTDTAPAVLLATVREGFERLRRDVVYGCTPIDVARAQVALDALQEVVGDLQAAVRHEADCAEAYKAEAVALRRTLESERRKNDTVLVALKRIADIAHSGGLEGMDQFKALCAVRRLTLRYWGGRHA